jgi:hypothetical protein
MKTPHFYYRLNRSLWLLPYCAVMPCNTIAFEEYIHSNVVVSMNVVKCKSIDTPAMVKVNSQAIYLHHDYEGCL